jgi:NADH dehydrogenase FAD-containing subunit
MLPSATVGTLELRSLLEPIRRIVGRVHGRFLKADAEEVEFSEKLVEISQVTREGEKRRFYLPYDKLVIGVGIIPQSTDESVHMYSQFPQGPQRIPTGLLVLNTATS